MRIRGPPPRPSSLSLSLSVPFLCKCIFSFLSVLARVCYNPVYCLLSGVEGVVVDMAKNEVTIKGIVEPQAVCSKIMKKTKRRARVLSPLPSSEGEAIPEVVTSQVS